MMGQWTNYNLRQYNSGLAHPHLRSDSSSTPGWFSNRKESALPLAAGEQSPLQVAHQAIMNLALTSARAFFATDLPATITESLRFVSALTSRIAVPDANPAVQSAEPTLDGPAARKPLGCGLESLPHPSKGPQFDCPAPVAIFGKLTSHQGVTTPQP